MTSLPDPTDPKSSHRYIPNAGEDIREMLAVIGDSANTGSIAVHRTFGFEPVGTIRSAGWKFERWLDVVLMQKSLGHGDAHPPSDSAG